mgnify:FL=1
MIRLALKNIWARKKRSGWLLAELVAVAIILCHLMDPLIVQTYVNSLPDGYDPENLYRVAFQEYSDVSIRYDKDAAEDEVREKNMWYIRDRVARYPGVESATFQVGNTTPGSLSYMVSAVWWTDSLKVSVFCIGFVPKSDYFTTFRYQTVAGASPQQLDRMELKGREHILTETYMPDGPIFGRTLKDLLGISEEPVVATLLPVKINMNIPPQQVQFEKMNARDAQAVVFRLRDDIDPDKFLADFREWADKELQQGNYYVSRVDPYQNFVKYSTTYVEQDCLQKMILASFFLFCIFFGVSGTFWMQTRSRCEEIGILKSFGATSGRILRLFLFEGLGLVTVAVLLGCVIYLQYALKSGLYMPQNLCCSPYVHYWFESFKEHFLIVSGVVWLLMVLIVSFGIYVPMRGISRIAPTEALHEE